MRIAVIWCLVCLSSVAHADWNKAGTAPFIPDRGEYHNSGFGSAVVAHSYAWKEIPTQQERDSRNGQWADFYFPSSAGPMTQPPATLPPSINCVFFFYHGGGWAGGNPRPGSDSQTQGEKPSFAALVDVFVNKYGCLFISTSYPLSDADSNGNLIPRDVDIGMYQQGAYLTSRTGINLRMIVGDDLLWGLRFGSAFQTFDLFYKSHYAAWKAHNPNLVLWVGGISAGAYLAQRVAQDGRWPVQKTLAIGIPILNPASQTPGARSVLQGDSPSDPRACMNRFTPKECAHYRNMYGEYQGGANFLDLNRYYGRNSALESSWYLGTICDQVAEVGGALLGWFNSLPGSKSLKIHEECTAYPGHACLHQATIDLAQSLDPTLPPQPPPSGVWETSGIWRFGSTASAPTLPPLPGSQPYSPYCQNSPKSGLINN